MSSIILYAKMTSLNAEKLLKGEKMLSEILRPVTYSKEKLYELETVPELPSRKQARVVAVTFPDSGPLEPHQCCVLDSQGDIYRLPPAVLNSGVVRVLSEYEVHKIADEHLDFNMLPSSDTVYDVMLLAPDDSARKKWGYYFMQAFKRRQNAKL